LMVSKNQIEDRVNLKFCRSSLQKQPQKAARIWCFTGNPQDWQVWNMQLALGSTTN
jgi:hypothetical protein